MDYNRPPLATLIDRILADIESRFESTKIRLRRNVFNRLGRVFAAALHALYGYIVFALDQVLPDKAAESMLVRQASLWLPNGGRKGADFAEGYASVVGTDGTPIPEGTQYVRGDGVLFVTEGSASVADGVASITLVALDAGSIGNTDVGVKLQLVTPIDGIEASATVTGLGLAGGDDIEEVEPLRGRVLERMRNPIQGGNKTDYPQWAREVAGVTDAWCYPKEQGPGTVVVRILRRNDPDPFPNADRCREVWEYIEAKMPVEVDLFVVSPIEAPLDFSIRLTPDTAEIRKAVVASLNDLILREAMPEDGHGSGTLLHSHIREGISSAQGEVDHELVLPSADVTRTTGQMTTMGTITWLP